jgi:recombination associated protein RdgC
MLSSQNRTIIDIGHQLYACRDQALSLCGEDGFRKIVAKWKPVFNQVMDRDNCNELQALKVLLANAKEISGDGFLMHQLSAVACELVEPTLSIG